jgi:hypothetical protein
MARKTFLGMATPPGTNLVLTNGPTPGYHFIYNINRPVGRGCKNEREDVLLVQVLLGRFFDDYGNAPSGRPLAVDGVFGDTTGLYIALF